MELGDDFRTWIHTTYKDRADFVLQGIYDFPSIHSSVLTKYKRDCKSKQRTWIWLTLSPDKFQRNLDNTPENLAALNTWCTKWFNSHSPYYHAYSWIIENGSNGDHLHVHAICEMKNSHKHAENLKKFWKKYFPNNQLLNKNEYYSKTFTDELILQDKLIYMDNEKKGYHENLSPTGCSGSHGVLSYI